MTEKQTRPTQDLTWATTGTKTDPGATKKNLGWDAYEKPNRFWDNWHKDALDAWATYFDKLRHYDNAENVVSLSTGPRDIAIVEEKDETVPFLSRLNWDSSAGAADHGKCVCSDGERVYWGDDNYVRAVNRETGVEDWNILVGWPIQDIRCDGNRVVFCYVNSLQGVNASTGANVWTYDHTAVLYSCEIDGNKWFACGARNAANRTAVRGTYDSNTVEQVYDHGAGVVLYCIRTDGQYVWTGGDPDAANQYLLVLDYTLTVIAQSTDFNANRVLSSLAVTDRFLFVGLSTWDAADDYTIFCFPRLGMAFTGFFDAVPFWTRGFQDAVNSLHADDRFLYVAVNHDATLGSTVWVFDQATGSLVAWQTLPGNLNATGVYSDGFALWVAHDNLGSPPDYCLSRMELQRGPVLAQKAKYSDGYKYLHQLVLPFGQGY